MSSKSEYALVLATPAQRSVVQYGYGRTLNGYVTTVASVLQRTADSVARRYNWGPEETTKEILSILRQEDRKLVLDKLRDTASNQCFPTLAKNCQQLMKYALPKEKVETQLVALESIVMLTTQYPGLRHFFLLSCGTSKTKIAAMNLWKRTNSTSKLDFFIEYAAACISGEVAEFVENTPADALGLVSKDGGVIEDLLRFWASYSVYQISGLIAVRYLIGVLQLRTFWDTNDTYHQYTTQKLFQRIRDALEDIGIGCNESLDSTTEKVTDLEGIDALTCTALEGIGEWIMGVTQEVARSLCWYRGFQKLIELLIGTDARKLVPNSWNQAMKFHEYKHMTEGTGNLHEAGFDSLGDNDVYDPQPRSSEPTDKKESSPSSKLQQLDLSEPIINLPKAADLFVAQLKTTGWSTFRDNVGQRYRRGVLTLHLDEGNALVIESDQWSPKSTGNQSVNFNLLDGVGNVAFHITIRGWTRNIVMNTQPVGGGWQSEEIIWGLDHFKETSTNQLAIINNRDSFEIYVNKAFLHRFTKRFTTDITTIEYSHRGSASFSDPVTVMVYESVLQYL